GDQRAPHKPLLVPYALGRWNRGKQAEVPFRRVQHALAALRSLVKLNVSAILAAAPPFPDARRCVGPQRAGNFGLRAAVEKTGAGNPTFSVRRPGNLARRGPPNRTAPSVLPRGPRLPGTLVITLGTVNDPFWLRGPSQPMRDIARAASMPRLISQPACRRM